MLGAGTPNHKSRTAGYGGCPVPYARCVTNDEKQPVAKILIDKAMEHPEARQDSGGRFRAEDVGWGGRIRTFGLLIQNQAPYRLATPQ